MTGDSYHQHGFAYITLLTAIAASLIVLSAAIPDIYQTAKREREAQLLFAGQEYVTAIEKFYNNPFVTVKRYPRSFDELLVDNRSPNPQYHLRRLYRDPITNTNDWGLIKNNERLIIGVYSLSQNRALRTNYSGSSSFVVVRGERYEDIKFVYFEN